MLVATFQQQGCHFGMAYIIRAASVQEVAVWQGGSANSNWKSGASPEDDTTDSSVPNLSLF